MEGCGWWAVSACVPCGDMQATRSAHNAGRRLRGCGLSNGHALDHSSRVLNSCCGCAGWVRAGDGPLQALAPPYIPPMSATGKHSGLER